MDPKNLDPSATYAIDNGQGEVITTGLSSHEALATAERIANERNESVYLYDATPLTEGEDGGPRPTVEIDPPKFRLAPGCPPTTERVCRCDEEIGDNADCPLHGIWE